LDIRNNKNIRTWTKACACVAGETKEELENSPFSEQLLEKGYEIIYFTDPVDEYVMQNLMEYDDYKFQSASKEDLKLGDKDAKKENKRLKVWVGEQDLALLKQASKP